VAILFAFKTPISDNGTSIPEISFEDHMSLHMSLLRCRLQVLMQFKRLQIKLFWLIVSTADSTTQDSFVASASAV